MDPGQLLSAQPPNPALALQTGSEAAPSLPLPGFHASAFPVQPPGMQLPAMAMPQHTAGLVPPAAAGPAPAPAPAPPGAFPSGIAMPPLMQSFGQLPVITDPVLLNQLTGVDLKIMQTNPAMVAMAQNLLAQRLIQQQFMNAGAGIITPQQMQFMQQQRLQQQQQQSKPARGKGKGKASQKSNAGAAKPSPPPRNPDGSLIKDDPGGKIIWAKLSNSPWWPAKTLDPIKDRSFPPDAEPPRPTAIPIRLLGTHEFGWVGSKRALTDWEEGFSQLSQECTQEIFAKAIEEAQTYLKEKTLPDAFYLTPEPDTVKKPAKGGRKKAPTTYNKKAEETLMALLPSGMAGLAGAGGGASGGMAVGGLSIFPPAAPPIAAAAVAGGGAAVGGNASARPKSSRAHELSAQDRAAVVFERKRQRLLDLGLMPPEDSPFANGAVALNPALLEKAEGWEQTSQAAMAAAREEVSKPEATAPPRASIFRPPPPRPQTIVEPPPPSQLPAPVSAPAPVAAGGMPPLHAGDVILGDQNPAMMGLVGVPMSFAAFY